MSDRRREVQELRENVARLDAEICRSLDSRAALSKKIHALLEAEASADGRPSADGSEREWLEKVLANSSGEMPAESLKVILRAIRAAGRAIEQPVRVAVVGPEGGFCYQSTIEAFGATTQTIECVTAVDALAEVARGRAAFAVFPFESSAEGLQQPTLLSIADSELVLVAERFLPSSYDLMSTAEEVSVIERVYMTAFAHAACQRFLDSELTRATIIDVRSPKDAAELARESKSSAAIVPEPCGRSFGLERLRENVGDLPDLRIRYGVAAQRPAARTGRDISCLLFSVENEPGSLYEVLRHFSERGINLRKLQSIPARRDGFEYYFYAEITGHASDRPVVTAFESVKRSVRYFRLLGSFPSAT